MVERKLFKTKLCVLYQKGYCPRHHCSFAHGSAELRHFSSSSYGGKRDYRGGDLRDKLDGRLSPRRRYSPRRDGGGKRVFHGSSPTRSLDQSRNRKRMKRQQFDGPSNFSGSLRNPDRGEDRARERSASPNARLVLDKQLREVQSDINMLDHQKSQLQILVEQKIEEEDSLTSRIQDLDDQVSKEKDECKRIVSKIKKFVKAHKRYLRSQDDLKRSQARLQKLGDQLISGSEEDSGMNVLSDGENGQHDGVQINNYFSKKTLGVKGDTVEEQTQAYLRARDEYQEESIKPGQLSGGYADPVPLVTNKEVVVVNKWNDGDQFTGNESKQKRGKNASLSNHLADKHLKVLGSGLLVPPTSMAGHAVDELVEHEEEIVEVVEAVDTINDGGAGAHDTRKMPVLLPPPPPPPPTFRNSYSQCKGGDEKVDVEGLEEDMVDVDIV